MKARDLLVVIVVIIIMAASFMYCFDNDPSFQLSQTYQRP